MVKEWSLDASEALGMAFTNEFAARQGWLEHTIDVPVDELEQFFSALRGRKVLDSGCGWGSYVHRFLDEELDYVGLDYSSEMIKAATATNPDALFVLGSYRAIPFPAEHFDGIWSCCTLSLMPKQYLKDVLSEHYRVLKPGGVMYCIMPSNNYSGEEMRTDNHGTPLYYHASYQALELKQQFNAVGFDTAIVYDRKFSVGAMLLVAQKW